MGPRRVGPEGWGPKGGRPKISLFFFPLFHHNFLSFFPLLGVFSWNVGGVFGGRGPEMCTFGVLELLCEAPALFVFTCVMDVRYQSIQAFVTGFGPFCNRSCKFVF